MLSDPTFRRITNANNCANTLHSQAFSPIYFLHLRLFYFSSDQMFCLLSLSILLFSFQHLWKCVSVYILRLYLFSTLQLFWSVCASPYTGLVTTMLFCLSTLSTNLVSKTENMFCLLSTGLFFFFLFFPFLFFFFFKSLLLTITAAPDAASLTICSHIFWCPPFFFYSFSADGPFLVKDRKKVK